MLDTAGDYDKLAGPQLSNGTQSGPRIGME
jgi:hypothetical protein